ncbi:hypothetical protein DPMN_130286 [Dreissena polymorpha]|uniref:Uncharacterized protein n=1 Tax=Dreissena polymorpha TaxID=45954 RepID=A0A9D4H2Q8_DREPO|nr:hypothetical protein DPMN_130286 [Dreissena polymorpha]
MTNFAHPRSLSSYPRSPPGWTSELYGLDRCQVAPVSLCLEQPKSRLAQLILIGSSKDLTNKGELFILFDVPYAYSQQFILFDVPYAYYQQFILFDVPYVRLFSAVHTVRCTLRLIRLC